MKTTLAFLVFFVFSITSQAQVNSRGLTHPELKNLITEFLQIMEPWMKENRNAVLTVNDQWNSNDASGGGVGARGVGGWNHIEVHVTGAFSKNQCATPDATLFAFCHELGHLAAKNQGYTDEPHADIFALRECLPRIFNKFASNQPLDLQKESEVCVKNESPLNVPLCARLLKASMDTAIFRYQYWIAHEAQCTKPSYEEESQDMYYTPQCGLDIAKFTLLKVRQPACFGNPKK